MSPMLVCVETVAAIVDPSGVALKATTSCSPVVSGSTSPGRDRRRASGSSCLSRPTRRSATPHRSTRQSACGSGPAARPGRRRCRWRCRSRRRRSGSSACCRASRRSTQRSGWLYERIGVPRERADKGDARLPSGETETLPMLPVDGRDLDDGATRGRDGIELVAAVLVVRLGDAGGDEVDLRAVRRPLRCRARRSHRRSSASAVGVLTTVSDTGTVKMCE